MDKGWGKINYLTSTGRTRYVLAFDSPSIEWAKFIIANRKRDNDKFVHGYDVVVGPVADDGVAFQLERYLNGGMNLEQLVKELTYKKLNRQYFSVRKKLLVISS